MRAQRWVSLLALGALLPIAACEFLRDPVLLQFEEQLAVHAVLLSGDTIAEVLVTRTNAGDSAFVIRGVPDAQVRLVSGSTSLTLTVKPGSNCFSHEFLGDPGLLEINRGCYSAHIPGGLRAGTTWQLLVDAGSLGNATGSATLPEAPAFSLPVAGARLASEGGFLGGSPTFTIRWSGVPRTRLAELDVAVPSRECSAYLAPQGTTGFGEEVIPVANADSLRARLGDSGCTISTQGMPAELRLVAYDSTYTLYRDENRGPRGTLERTSSMGLSGAVGVFAGAARAVLPILLVRS
jgi:hypothetical protein